METKTADSAMLERASLYKVVESPEHAARILTVELLSLKVDHDLEIVFLQGKLDQNVMNDRPQWRARTRHALQRLKLQVRWIAEELDKRDRAERQARHNRAVEQARQARMARIAKANEDDRRQKVMFFEVAREVLGLEMYTHIWELARIRAAESKG